MRSEWKKATVHFDRRWWPRQTFAWQLLLHGAASSYWHDSAPVLLLVAQMHTKGQLIARYSDTKITHYYIYIKDIGKVIMPHKSYMNL
jgi:hypothetical protein